MHHRCTSIVSIQFIATCRAGNKHCNFSDTFLGSLFKVISIHPWFAMLWLRMRSYRVICNFFLEDLCSNKDSNNREQTLLLFICQHDLASSTNNNIQPLWMVCILSSVVILCNFTTLNACLPLNRVLLFFETFKSIRCFCSRRKSW